MFIDFHTHAFDDSIAERAVAKLEDTIIKSGFPNPLPSITRGTVKELLEIFDKSGVDAGVLLPIATKPNQQESINNWAAKIQSDKLYCFGTVHPEAEDWEAELERIKSLGLHGVKLHPDYQNFSAGEERLFPLYEKCAGLGLPVILHAGLDAVSMDIIHCTPEMGVEIIERVPSLTLIMAHLGGSECWDSVEEHLAGKNVYLDTALISGSLPQEQAYRIIKKHGAEKILFASDCPWHNPRFEIEFIESLPLTETEKELIFYKNAQRLLFNMY